MEKKEFPKKNTFKREGKSDSTFSAPRKLSKFQGKVLGIVKFILGICLLPFVYSVSCAFLSEFSRVPGSLQRYFWGGVISLLVVFLFIWEPLVVYTRGQEILELVFGFFRPLIKIAPYLLPIYTLIALVIYELLVVLFDMPETSVNYFIFILGLTMALHIVFSGKSLRAKGDFLKADYIFYFSFVYILNIGLLSFCVNIIYPNFHLFDFCNESFQIAKGIFSAVFKQLFVP